jgi:hypothetical protein
MVKKYYIFKKDKNNLCSLSTIPCFWSFDAMLLLLLISPLHSPNTTPFSELYSIMIRTKLPDEIPQSASFKSLISRLNEPISIQQSLEQLDPLLENSIFSFPSTFI